MGGNAIKYFALIIHLILCLSLASAVEEVTSNPTLPSYPIKDGVDDSTVPEVKQEVSDVSAVPEVKQEVSDDSTVPEVKQEVSDVSAVPEVKQEVSDVLAVPEVKQEVSAVSEVKQEVSDDSAVPEVKQEVSDDSAVPVVKQEVSDDSAVPEVKQDVSDGSSSCQWPPDSRLTFTISRNHQGEFSTTLSVTGNLGNLTFGMDELVGYHGNDGITVVSGYYKERGNLGIDVYNDTKTDKLDGDRNKVKYNGENKDCGKCCTEYENKLVAIDNRVQDGVQQTNTAIGQIYNRLVGRLNLIEQSLALIMEKLKVNEDSKSSEEKEEPPEESIPKPRSKLLFHPDFKGKHVVLSQDFRSADRANPRVDHGEFGGVITQRPLQDDELFQIRIDDTIVYKSDYGLSLGLIKNPDNQINSAYHIFSRDSTWSLYSTPDQTSYYATTFIGDSRINRRYPINLFYLLEGTTLGVVRRRNGDVHFYYNGVDKGVAFSKVHGEVYGFVDVMHYVKRISILD